MLTLDWQLQKYEVYNLSMPQYFIDVILADGRILYKTFRKALFIVPYTRTVRDVAMMRKKSYSWSADKLQRYWLWLPFTASWPDRKLCMRTFIMHTTITNKLALIYEYYAHVKIVLKHVFFSSLTCIVLISKCVIFFNFKYIVPHMFYTSLFYYYATYSVVGL